MTHETPRRETTDEWIRRLSAGFDDLTAEEPPPPASAVTPTATPEARPGYLDLPAVPPIPPPSAPVRSPTTAPTIGQWGRIEDPQPWSGAETRTEAAAPSVAPEPELRRAPEPLPDPPLRAPAPGPAVTEAPALTDPVAARSRLDWPARSEVSVTSPPIARPDPVALSENDVLPRSAALPGTEWQAKGRGLKEQILAEPIVAPPPVAPVAPPPSREAPEAPIAAAVTDVAPEEAATSWPGVTDPEQAGRGGPPPEPPRRRSRNPIDRWTEGWPHPLRVAVDWLVTIVGAVAIVLLVKAYVINPYRIPSSSMEPTLHCREGAQGCLARFSDRVLANRFIYHFRSPKRSDIVVFDTPPAARQACGSGGTYVKRLIGLPGETIEVRVRQGSGYVFINGKELPEPYLQPDRRTVTGEYGPFTIPAGNYFMMGDNRGSSCDSRSWGTVPRKNIIGKVFMVYWPPNRISFR